MTQLTTNFTLEELITTDSEDPAIKQIQARPSDQTIVNLTKLADRVLQPCREIVRVPMMVTSGWRCKALNEAVGGSDNSYHLHGLAADIVSRGKTAIYHKEKRYVVPSTFAVFYTLAMNHTVYTRVDQVIHEWGDYGNPAWVHVAINKEGDRPRNHAMIKDKDGYRYLYEEEFDRMVKSAAAIALTL